MKKLLSFILCVVVFVSCKTVDLEKRNKRDIEKTKKAESEQSLPVENFYATGNQTDFIERPVYQPYTETSDAPEKIQGKDAVGKSLKAATQLPQNYKDGTFFYQFNENFVYEIYAQPYHLTDIILEKGEVVLGTPLLSEDESVWELTANVAKDPADQIDIQHLFIKPAYSGLDSSLVIITDKRVYHFRIKSFKDVHMAMIKFTYPEQKNVWAKKKDKSIIENEFIKITNPELLSFDYKMRYVRKPEFLPRRVYDDGQSTFIQVPEIVLQKQLPLIFNKKNELVNYSVKKNVFCIPRLIEKVTMKLGKQKVVIEKKIKK